MEVEW